MTSLPAAPVRILVGALRQGDQIAAATGVLRVWAAIGAVAQAGTRPTQPGAGRSATTVALLAGVRGAASTGRTGARTVARTVARGAERSVRVSGAVRC